MQRTTERLKKPIAWTKNPKGSLKAGNEPLFMDVYKYPI